MLKKFYKELFSEAQRKKARILFQKMVHAFYLGDRFHCNCCGKNFRTFLPKGHIPRPNAKCPYCLSLERVRLLDLYLTREVGLYGRKGWKVLHFAPEEILFEKLSQLPIEYVDADINPANARNIIDITYIDFPNDYFDLVICSHVLGHVPDEAKAIEELYRVLKQNGTALVMTLLNPNPVATLEDPNIRSAEDRQKQYGEPDLYRLHGTDFSDRLRKSGFHVERIDYRQQVFPIELRKNSLGNGDREIIFKCTKKNAF
jgi:SAM-dependent methyltransferase